MRDIPKKPSLTERVLVRAYRTAQATFDPKAHIEDSKIIARAELDARHASFVVPEINKPHKEGADNHNYLTDKERERWFGKSGFLKPEDVTWEKLEEILKPSARRGAVTRINGSVRGSYNNARFSSMQHSTSVNKAGYTQVSYTPRTISVYDDKEQAITAAKVLRILTRNDAGNDSVASILAEAIENGSGDPVWVVSDNMTLQTHNALRLYFSNQAQKLSPEKIKTLREHTQEEVNLRLLPGEKWGTQNGVGTLLTLQGRPGIKMYKKLDNGKDDPKDVARLSRIREQELPRIVKGVPHDLVIASDGREYFDSGDTFASIATILVGPKGYAFLRTGNPKLVGELIKQQSDFAIKPTAATNAFAFGRDATAAIQDGLTFVTDQAFSLSAGLATVLLHGSAIAAGASFYSVFKRISEKDPMKNSIRHWVEERCGPLNETKLYKIWEPPENLPAIVLKPKDVDPPELCASLNLIKTPLGDITLSQRAQAAFKNNPPSFQERINSNQKLPMDFAHGFKNFMRSHAQWPKGVELESENPIPKKFFENNGAFFKARDDLAVAFGLWFERICRTHDATASEKLSQAIVDFSEILRKSHGLSVEVAETITDATRQALTKGINNYLEYGVEANKPLEKIATSLTK